MIILKPIVARPPDVKAMEREVMAGLQGVGNGIQEDFQSTTTDWDHEVPIVTVLTVTSRQVKIEIVINDPIWHMVDQGTPAHAIFAGIYTGRSDKKALTIRGGSPKTRPGLIGSGPGVRGPVVALRPYVEHPGTTPREFSKTIRRKWERKMKDEMTRAINRAAKASGHSWR